MKMNLKGSLRAKLILVFLSLAIIPLLVASIFIGYFSYSNQLNQAKSVQKLIALRASEGVLSFFRNSTLELVTLIQTHELLAMNHGELDELLRLIIFGKNQFGHEPNRFLQLRILDASGATKVVASIDSPEVSEKEWSAFETDFSLVTQREALAFLGPIRYPLEIAEPLISVFLPLETYNGEDPEGYIAGLLRLQKIWGHLERFSIGFRSTVFLLNERGRVIAHPDPSVVLSGITHQLPESPGVGTGLLGGLVLENWHTINFGGQSLVIVAEQPISEVISLTLEFASTLGAVMLVAIILSGLISLWVMRDVLIPMEKLTNAIRQVGKGELFTRVYLHRNDEIGYLANQFNEMTTSLDDHSTKLKGSNLELQRMNRELDEFSYVASHDLQEPLRKLRAFGGLLLKDLENNDRERVEKDIRFITDSVNHMEKLIQDLLSLSRSSRATLSVEPVALDTCVDLALESLSLLLEERRANVVREQLPVVNGDKMQLTQVYQNLVSNAIKYHPGSPTVWISADQAELGWVFGVKDNGTGIHPDYHAQIFLPFKRLHGRSEHEGTGMGLAICRKVIERHGGKIWVESQEGEGAHFKFTIDMKGIES